MTVYSSVIVFNDTLNRVLLVKKVRGPKFLIGKWTAIGGKVEDGETPAAAASRELAEEAGVQDVDIRLVAVIDRGADAVCHIHCAFARDFYEYDTRTDEDIHGWSLPLPPVRSDSQGSFSEDMRFLIEMALQKMIGSKQTYRIEGQL